jgi:hypothetical protein
MLMLMYWVGAYTYYKESTQALVVASKEIGLEVNAEKTEYMVMSRDENTGKMGTHR